MNDIHEQNNHAPPPQDKIKRLHNFQYYLLNYMNGKAKNQRLATAWLNCHRELLESNFSLVGAYKNNIHLWTKQTPKMLDSHLIAPPAGNMKN